MHSKSTPYALTDGSTIAVDWNNSQVQYVTMAGSRTFTFSNGVSGQTYILKITQDASGSRTPTLPSSVKWASGSAPSWTSTASKTDVVQFVFDGTYYIGSAIGLNYTL